MENTGIFGDELPAAIEVFRETIVSVLERIRKECGDQTAEAVRANIEIKALGDEDISCMLFGEIFTCDTSPIIAAALAVAQGHDPEEATARIPDLYRGALGRTESEAKSAFKIATKNLARDACAKETQLAECEARSKDAAAAHTAIVNIMQTSGYARTRKADKLIPYMDKLPENVRRVLAEAADPKTGFFRRAQSRESLASAITATLEALEKDKRDAISVLKESRQTLAAARTALANLKYADVWRERCQSILSALTSRELASLRGLPKLAKVGELTGMLIDEYCEGAVVNFFNTYNRALQAIEITNPLEKWGRLAERIAQRQELDSKIKKAKADRQALERAIAAITAEVPSAVSPDTAKGLTDKLAKLNQQVSVHDKEIEKAGRLLNYNCVSLVHRAIDIAIAEALISVSTGLERVITALKTVSHTIFGIEPEAFENMSAQACNAAGDVIRELDAGIIDLIMDEINRAAAAQILEHTENVRMMKGHLPAAFDFQALRSFEKSGGKAVVFGIDYGSSWYCTKGNPYGSCYGGRLKDEETYYRRELRGFPAFRRCIEEDFEKRIPWQLFVKFTHDDSPYREHSDWRISVPAVPAREQVLWLPCPPEADIVNLKRSLDRFRSMSGKNFSRKHFCDEFRGHVRAFGVISSEEKEEEKEI